MGTHKEHEEFYAHRYRLAQANKLLRLFREGNGRDAKTPDEAASWLTRHPPTPAGPVKPDPEDFESVVLQADAELYRLAQANKLSRLYREAHGHDAETPDELTSWLERHQILQAGPVKPDPEDFESARSEDTD